MQARPLRIRIKLPYRFNLIAKEVDAHRPIHLRRIHVDNAAANRHLARHLDDVNPRVADRKQMLDQHLGHVLFALLQLQRKARIVVAPKQFHAHSFNWRDHQPCSAGRQLPQRNGSLLLNFRVRRKILKRENIVRRKPQDLRGRDHSRQLTSCQYRRMQSLRRLIVGNNHQRRRLPRPHKVRKVKSASRGCESGHTSTPRATCQMAAYTLKCCGGLQVRH